MTTHQIAGLDIGYGYTKIQTAKTKTTFPSIIGNPVQLRYRGNLITNGSNHTSAADIRLNTPDGTRFVGQLAASQSDLTWSPQNRSRTESDDIITLMLAAFSEAGLSGKINLVTGLPVRWYSDKDKLLKKLRGSHIINRQGHKKTTVVIEDLAILPQPFGTIYDQILTPTAKITKAKQPLLSQTIAVLDIGMHTSDYIICNHCEYHEAKSDSTETGMSTLYKLLARSVEDRLGLPLTLHQADAAVRAGHITVAGQKRSLATIIEPILQMVAQKILSALSATWGEGKDIDTLFISGGGASAIGPYLAGHYPQMTIIEDSQTANVSGYYKYGLLKWRSP